jgi:hypothetical protein
VQADHRDRDQVRRRQCGREQRQRAVAERRPEHGQAGRPPVRGEAVRHGHRGEVEQVRELGVPAQRQVAPDRVGGDLGVRVRGPDGRQHQRVDPPPQPVRPGA